MNKTGKILVVGSSNTDLVVKTAKLPKPGETVVGGEYFKFHGGKGANQAMAAAKLGGNVSFIGKVGNDAFGGDAVRNLEEAGVDIESVLVDSKAPSGIALIMVDDKGENSIAVASGANSTLSPEDVEELVPVIKAHDLILLQHEIPRDTICAILEIANTAGIPVVLNPAPAMAWDESYLSRVFLLIPNEYEAESITGIQVRDVESAYEAGRSILSKGVRNVVITMGKHGVVYLGESIETFIPATVVTAVDTTAAGDTFCGAIAVRLCEGASIESAIRFAVEAAGISVTRMGAQNSQPYRSEIQL